jgi:hypothetical protein
MTPVVVPEQTGELARRWLIATLAAAVVAATIPVIAGGPEAWARAVLGIVTIVGFTLASRHRWTLNLPVASALLAVVAVPDTATVDRAIVAFPTAIGVLVAIECAVVTRRLDTAAPVTSTSHDPAVIVATVATAAIASGIVAGLAQLDRFGWRAPAAGATVALGVVALTVRGRLESE